ncbi:hypothetical protein VNO78_23804 [Psophocarpus tetragonolobus]|uniref:Uncharacterized protein n=1 Tax=Psophocarpus tetragonolobus TaxID=3891 RepID=A0AAN9S4A7_PSOTE
MLCSLVTCAKVDYSLRCSSPGHPLSAESVEPIFKNQSSTVSCNRFKSWKRNLSNAWRRDKAASRATSTLPTLNFVSVFAWQ